MLGNSLSPLQTDKSVSFNNPEWTVRCEIMNPLKVFKWVDYPCSALLHSLDNISFNSWRFCHLAYQNIWQKVNVMFKHCFFSMVILAEVVFEPRGVMHVRYLICIAVLVIYVEKYGS